MSEKSDLESDSQTGSGHRNRKQNHVIREVVEIDSDSDDSSNSEPEQLVVSSSKVSSNIERSDNEIADENKKSPEQKNTEEKMSNQRVQMNHGAVKMSTKKYGSFVLATSTIFVVDNVKLYVKNSVPSSYGAKDHRIHLDCPCCKNGTVEPYTKIGEHLKDEHDVTHISCPGARCGKFKEIDVRSFRTHLETFHMTILCQHCTKPLTALKIIEHIMAAHPDKHNYGGKNSNQETLHLRYEEQKKSKKRRIKSPTIVPRFRNS